MDIIISYIDPLRSVPVQYRAIRKPASPALCWAVLVRQHGQKQRIDAGACPVTPPDTLMENTLFAFRVASNTAPRAPHRFPLSEAGREIHPQSDRFKGGAGSSTRQPRQIPPTLGAYHSGASAGKSRSTTISRVSTAPQLYRGANKGETIAVYCRSGDDRRR
jgi:hypothetical protein